MADDPQIAGGGSSGWSEEPCAPTGFEVGALISYTYRVEALLARGGMGEVYRTTHTEIGSAHAIKIVRPELAKDDKIMKLFRREAAVLRSLRDDAVVGYDGVLRDAAGRVCLVMEFVDGPSLSAYLANRRLTPMEVRALRDRLACGLAAAHDKGVVHRDISPDNIILGEGELSQAKIIDFGIAKLSNSAATTIIGEDFAGRYAYASPEQFGLFGGRVDARSDIYSLGLVLARATAGRPLDMGGINESLVSVIEARKRVPDLSSVPAALRRSLMVMLQPDPADRPQSMRAVIDLERPATISPTRLHPATAPLAAEVSVRAGPTGVDRHPWRLVVLAGGLLLAVGGGYLAWQNDGAPQIDPLAQVDPLAEVGPSATAERRDSAGIGPPDAELDAETQLNRAQKREIQKQLRALGHYAGDIDGKFGAATRAGIESYQRGAGFAVTGYLTAEDRRDLALAAKAAAEAKAETPESHSSVGDAGKASESAAEFAEPAAESADAEAERTLTLAAPRQQQAPSPERKLLAAPSGETDLDRLRRTAEAGDALAQAGLGQRYYRGDGVQRDFQEAARWTRLAAEQGEASAQASLGFYFMNGEGVPRDSLEAARWWRSAALQGVWQAQYNMGILYETGQGVAADPLEAARWYRLAVGQGSRQAGGRLDSMIRKTLALPRS